MTQLQAMLASMAIEAPVAYGLAAWARWPCRGPLHVAIAATLATAATHPQLWYAVEHLASYADYWRVALLAEACVVLVEAAILAWAGGLALLPALAVSASANGASAAIGVLLFS